MATLGHIQGPIKLKKVPENVFKAIANTLRSLDILLEPH